MYFNVLWVFFVATVALKDHLKEVLFKSSLFKHNYCLVRFGLSWNNFTHFWSYPWRWFLPPLFQKWKSSVICLILVVLFKIFLNFNIRLAPKVQLALLKSDQNDRKWSHKRPNFRRLSLWFHGRFTIEYLNNYQVYDAMCRMNKRASFQLSAGAEFRLLFCRVI